VPLTDEHVISEGLGCQEVLCKAVCVECNSRFGHTFEAKAVNDLVFFRNLMRIPGKSGAVPEYRCDGGINGQPIEVVFAGTGEVLIATRSLGESKDENTASKAYMVFRKKEEHIIEKNLRRRHNDLIWKRLPGDEGRGTVEVRAAFDASTLCSLEMSRTIAKFGLNLIAEAFGANTLFGHFEELRHFVNTGECTGSVPAGIIWEPQTLKRLPQEPPKHLFILFRDGKQHHIIILIYLFSLFPYCVVARDSEIKTDAFQSRTLDPYDGRFAPLLATRPFPEVPLARAIANAPRGTLQQAIPAAQHAHKWLTDACEQSCSAGDPVICYESGRVQKPGTATCTYCGKTTLPAAQEPVSQ